VLFVRNDSPIRTVDDLQSGDIAFNGSWNVCSILVQHVLHKEHPDLKFRQLYTGSMNNVVNHVLLGKAAAGSIIDAEFEAIAPETRRYLRPLLETQKIPPHPFSAHPRVPKAIRDRVAAALLDLRESEEGRALLLETRITNPVRADYERDYSQLEAIDLTYSGN
jgi:phosphonate transport system substrate-binding protein